MFYELPFDNNYTFSLCYPPEESINHDCFPPSPLSAERAFEQEKLFRCRLVTCHLSRAPRAIMPDRNDKSHGTVIYTLAQDKNSGSPSRRVRIDSFRPICRSRVKPMSRRFLFFFFFFTSSSGTSLGQDRPGHRMSSSSLNSSSGSKSSVRLLAKFWDRDKCHRNVTTGEWWWLN